MYIKLNKALYGLLQSVVLFYKELMGDLVSKGFKINDYDPCVAYKDINRHKMIVTWHVDDLNVSNRDPFEITKFASWLSGIYGENLAVHRGKRHDYLGMDLDYSDPGKVKISMIKYLHKIIQGFPEVIKSGAATPTADHFFRCGKMGRPNFCPNNRSCLIVTQSHNYFFCWPAQEETYNSPWHS